MYNWEQYTNKYAHTMHTFEAHKGPAHEKL